MDLSRVDDRPDEDLGVIKEVELHDVPTVRMAVSIWDRALVGLFAVAIAGGLTIAIANAIGENPAGAAAASESPSRTAASESPSSAAASPSPSPSRSSPQRDPTAVPTLRPGSFWEQTAIRHRASTGERFTYDCPPGGTLLPLWGTGVYTDDSSVCTAAVHWGAITLEEGGTVTIEIRRAKDVYRGSRRNGVTSQDWLERWHGSFVFTVP